MKLNASEIRRKWLAGWYWELLCLIVYFIFAADQLFVPPIIGIADNGDFPKALAPYSICDPNGEADIFAYVFPRYVIDGKCHWEPHLPSSELLLVRLQKAIARWSGRRTIGITGAGKSHLAIAIAALAILLWGLHRQPNRLRFGLPPLFILIFSDVGYVSYFNSFYMDAASLVFLLLTVSFLVAWVLRPRRWIAIGYAIAGVLMSTSKTQHTITALLLAGVGAWFAVRLSRLAGAKRDVVYWAASAAVVAAAAVLTIVITPADYKDEPLYSVIFYRMPPDLSDKAQALAELGLPASDAVYFGTHAYSDGAPMSRPDWREDFDRRVSVGRVVFFYLRHPSISFHMILRGLKETYGIRPAAFGNYTKEDGYPRGWLATRFAWWSNLRGWLMRIFPMHLVFFYACMAVGASLCLFRRDLASRWPLYPLVLALVASGVLEFLMGVLLDGTEVDRHLFLFHVITEILFLCAFSGALALHKGRTSANTREPATAMV